jgi:hypothetical protein
MQPLLEYLRLLDEFTQCRDSKNLNVIQDKIQEVINRHSSGIPEMLPFIERYKRSVAAIHIHGSIRLALTERRLYYCATVENAPSSRFHTTAVLNELTLANAATDKIQMSVLVDVREVGKESQISIESTPTIVRLHTLDNCKRLVGNPRKVIGELTLRQRERATARNLGSKRKLTVFAPAGIYGGNCQIGLDNIKRQMIEGGPHLINHFASKNGNYLRRWFGDIQLLFSFRPRDEFVGLSSGIIGNASLNGAEVFCRPGELEFRRFHTADHMRRKYQRKKS